MGTKDDTNLRWGSHTVERDLRRLVRLFTSDSKRSLRVETTKDSRAAGLRTGEIRVVDEYRLLAIAIGAGLRLRALMITTRRSAAVNSASLFTTAILFQ